MFKRLLTSIAVPLLLVAVLVGVLSAPVGSIEVAQAAPASARLFPPTYPYSTFLSLIDTPSSYSGEACRVPVVNSGETGLDFASGLCWDDANDLLGLGISASDGTLHVHSASAGAVTADVNCNDLVVENSANGGVSLLTPDANWSKLYFGSPSDELGALMQWSYNSSRIEIGTHKEGSEIRLKSGEWNTAMSIVDEGVGIGDSTPSYPLDVAGTIRAQEDLRADDDLFVADDGTFGGSLTTSGIVQGADLIATDDLLVYDDADVCSDLSVLGGTFLGQFEDSEEAGDDMLLRGYYWGAGGFVYFVEPTVIADLTIFADESQGGDVGPEDAILAKYLVKQGTTGDVTYDAGLYMADGDTVTIAGSGGETLALAFARPIVPGQTGKLWLNHTGVYSYQVVMEIMFLD